MKKKKFSLFLLAAFIVIIPLLATVASAAPTFPDANFQSVWSRPDKILTERTGVGRGFVWGPESILNGNESYTEAPGGQRLVQYFDKARMEVNNPAGDRSDPNFVTSGLLVKELVLGRQQNGNDVNKFTQGNPSEVQIAGDPNTGGANATAPTYRSFRNIATFNNDNPVNPKLGEQVVDKIDKAGNITAITSPDPSVKFTAYESATKHNIADVFIAYGNTQGLIWNGSAYVNGPLFYPNATYVFGLPITDAYWIKAVVAGVEKDILVQLFERRVLTYTPTNDANSKVEMGNVGQHYYRWRYVENLGIGTTTPTTPPISATPTTPVSTTTTASPTATSTPTPTPTPIPVPSNDYTQGRAPYLKTGSIPQGVTSSNVTSYPTGAGAINSSPVYDPDKKLAIIGTAGNGVVGVNVTNFSTPTQSWKFQPVGVNFNSPVVLFNGIVYIGGSDGKIYAIKEADGTQLWASTATGGPVTSQIALDVDTAYVVSADGKLYAINLSTGTPKWQNQPAAVNLVNSPIIAPDGTLYIAGNDKKVYAFKKDGSQVPTTTWNPTALDDLITTTPTYGNGRLYVGTANGTLYALNSNGTVQTQKTFTATKPIYTTPAVVTVSGVVRVYVGTDDGSVYGVDANNVATVQWTFMIPLMPLIHSSIAEVDGFIYFAAEDKKVYRVEAGNSSNSLVLTTASGLFGTNSAVVNSGYLVIASQDGNLYLVK
ncbi:MAG: PQQ-binding-like beta-propeller repeat protein [Chloroflexota bacterium]|nr:PQQ-binding-like beta-propeller repeat protein [Chloroflexota bacterium]